MIDGDVIRFDAAVRRVWRGSLELQITRKAFDLLALLIERRPAVVSKEEIHGRLWPDTFVSDVTLHSLMSELRRALGGETEGRPCIRTVHGVGYAFVGSLESSPAASSTAGRPVRGWLVSETGRLKLFDGENLLGRGVDDSDVIDVASPSVSRRHAMIRFDECAWLEDLGSKNGTFVGDSRVTDRVRLADGDRVRLGSVLLTFRFSHAAGGLSTQTVSGRTPG